LIHNRNPDDTMLLQRSALALARRAAVAPALRRSIATTAVRRKQKYPDPGGPSTRGSSKMSRTLVTELPRPTN
jgi:cytochrome c oxidase subunit 5b